MAVARTRRRPGPEPKGVRRQFTLRVPDDHLALYKREADARGMPLADYLAAALARDHGLPEPAYIHRNRAQARAEEMLPLTGTDG